VLHNLTQVPVAREDLQAMGYYCWLKAKITNQDYYQTLLDTVNLSNH